VPVTVHDGCHAACTKEEEVSDIAPPLRACLIGCGFISHQHAPAWHATPHADLLAVCDQDLDRARRRAHEWGVPRAFSDPEEMLRQVPVDIVDIVTRPESHMELVALAAGAGCQVLCQKPLAPTLGEASAMVELCETRAVRFMVTEMWRYLPWFREITAQISAGAIGDAHYMRIVGSRRMMRRNRPINDTQPYMADMSKFIIYEMMIHWIDAARAVLGEITSVYARTAQLNPVIAGEDAALIVLGHERGATSSLDGSWGVPPDSALGSSREGDIVVEGKDGVLHFSPLTGDLRRTTSDSSLVIARFPDIEASFQQAFNACIGHFAECVRKGQPFQSSAADNLRTLAATFAAYDSAASGQAVALTYDR